VEAIQLNNVMPLHRYACRGIEVTPNPPRVGEVTTFALALQNTGPESITVNRIQFRVAAFGMVVGWEQLPAIEDLLLPSHARQAVEIQWTPTMGGHRCVRATIEADVLSHPLRLGRNLSVIEATSDQRRWHVPFRLGNPDNERKPVTLELGGDHPESVDVQVLINGQLVQTGRPVWLNAREEVDAHLMLRARTAEAIQTVQTVEAFIEGRFIDGIQVEVARPAFLFRPALMQPEIAQRAEALDYAETASMLANSF